MWIAAIIQARLGSKRLPGKCMMDIAGIPLLGHVINGARLAVENVIVATPDKEIVDFAIKQGVLGFIGSEDDVLDRYYKAAKAYEVQHIIRLTSDNPLVDPDVIQKVLDFYWSDNFDYVSNNHPRTYPIGLDVEIFTFEALERTWREAKDKYEREHVTPYIYNHPELFKLGNVKSDKDLSHLRWTVDTLEDLEHVRELCELVKK